MKTTIPHQAIFCGPDTLFIVNGDQNLIEIHGESTPLIKEILKGIQQEEPLERIYENHKRDFGHDIETFQELISWMKEKQVIQQPRSPQTIKIHLLIGATYSNQSTSSIINSLNQLSLNSFEYLLEDNLKASDLILYMGSLFTHRSSIKELAQLSYEAKIPLLYTEIDSSSFTLGPIISPELLSPCLNCYADRKQVQLKNPKAFSILQKKQNQEYIYTPLVENKKYFPALINFINEEIHQFFLSGLTYSPLLSQSYVVNGSPIEIQKYNILKVPHCPICSQKNQSMTFNV
ncbi:hypothetical protein EWU23_11210 [Cytophagaceae bacterium 50C-KIRBA]|uniref:TOMM leader peptide-binding protein n=1 Tax=Aquirufa beregesia TaxID=2516556 RepID=A0ABX0F201_9BACT|nr:hypothetical protein [Aquirufa beregesia]NGZ45044.1 hypothetical protein [Aquirufa beregesia]